MENIDIHVNVSFTFLVIISLAGVYYDVISQKGAGLHFSFFSLAATRISSSSRSAPLTMASFSELKDLVVVESTLLSCQSVSRSCWGNHPEQGIKSPPGLIWKLQDPSLAFSVSHEPLSYGEVRSTLTVCLNNLSLSRFMFSTYCNIN